MSVGYTFLMHAKGSKERADAFRFLLESYVLKCAEALPTSRQADIDHALAETIGPAPDWLAAIGAHFDFSDDMASEIAGQWREGHQSADDAGFDIEPIEFARILVDRYMSDLVTNG